MLGRQGIRARRELNPVCGSADLPWDLPPRSFPFLPVVLLQSGVARSLRLQLNLLDPLFLLLSLRRVVRLLVQLR